MTLLTYVLILKIAISLLCLVAPYLLLPSARLDTITWLPKGTPLMYRLYGTAILALLVAYGSGNYSLAHGIFPWGIVLMGIVSNLGATAYMLMSQQRRALRGGIAFFGAIGLLLVAAALMPDVFSRPV
ncbi:hypothetical protein BXY66_0153 [Shimia isoporae]|uniref:DoxX-like protein n=1 Tax=Shimia isoporae TaxID=647720 RepID=A0A4V2Q3Q8_9RHOB|nr:hypothetical protein [Shimia isoporae]TCL08120.1 hypothetical protein BXY66_0153 [Shimia isoporae]